MKKLCMLLLLNLILIPLSLSANSINKSILEDGTPDTNTVPSPLFKYKVIDVSNFTPWDLSWSNYLKCIEQSDKLEELRVWGLNPIHYSLPAVPKEMRLHDLVKSLKGKKLKKFVLRDNALDSTDCAFIIPILRDQWSLESVDASNNPSLGDKGIIFLNEAIQNHTRLKKINFSKTGMTSLSAKKCLGSLRDHPALCSLNLSHNAINSDILIEEKKNAQDVPSLSLLPFIRGCMNLVVVQLSGNDSFVSLTPSQVTLVRGTTLQRKQAGAFEMYEQLCKDGRKIIVSDAYLEFTNKLAPSSKMPLGLTKGKSADTEGPIKNGDFFFQPLNDTDSYKTDAELYEKYKKFYVED